MIVKEKPFTIEDIKDAREAFSCSSTTFIMPVVEIDDCKIGDGCPGEHTLRLRRLYINNVKKELKTKKIHKEIRLVKKTGK